MSASGQYQTAVTSSSSSDGYVYTSSDFGSSWSQQTTPTSNWQSVAVSGSGQYQVAVSTSGSSLGGYIYISSNFGASWSQQTTTSSNWQSVAVSVSGQYQTAVSLGSTIYVSSDYGNSWSSISGTSKYWLSVAMTASGQYQIASTTDDAKAGDAKIVTSFADEFDVGKILEAHDKELMAGLDNIDEMNFVRKEATVCDSSKKSKAAGEIMDYLTNGIQEGEDDNGLSDQDMDNNDDDGALANAKMEEAEGFEFGQE
jgi:hypothetical protein